MSVYNEEIDILPSPFEQDYNVFVDEMEKEWILSLIPTPNEIAMAKAMRISQLLPM